MDSNLSSDEVGPAALDLNAASAALDLNDASAAAAAVSAVQHQEHSTDAAASEPTADQLDNINSSGGTTAETLDKPPDGSVDSGKGCSTELGSGDGSSRGQNTEMDAASNLVVEGVGDEVSAGVLEPGGTKAEVVETNNRTELMGEGVSSPEKKQSRENGGVVPDVVAGHPSSKAMGGGSEGTNLIDNGEGAAIELEVTTNAPVVEVASDNDKGELVTADVCSEADGVSQQGADKISEKAQEPLERVKRVPVEPQTSAMEDDQRARYDLPPLEDETAFSVSNLVWGKVRSYPWWPGEIFDPSDASEMALKIQKENKFLIAYFGDKTFAWNEGVQLKPFNKYFSQMAKQSKNEGFTDAVKAALGEITRRVELGMTCSCYADEACANMKYQKVENAGIREGTCSSAVDRTLIANYFQPDKLLEYIKALTLFPSGGVDRLELAIAMAQLKAFYRSKGYPEPPIFLMGGGLMENDSKVSPSESKKPAEDSADRSTSNPVKRKSRGRESSFGKQKHLSDDGRKRKRLSELMEEKEVPHLASGGKDGSRRKTVLLSRSKKPKVLDSDSPAKVLDSDSPDLGKTKKKRLGSLGDIEARTPSPRSIKVGERIRRAASQLTGSPSPSPSPSPSFLKSNGETKSAAKAKRKHGDVIGVDGTSHTHAETSIIRKGASKVYSSPSELLSQLCLLASDPMKGYSFLPDITSFFTDFWASLTSSSSEDKEQVEDVGGKRGRRKSGNVKSSSTEKVMPDYAQDSYWSDVIFRNSPEELASSGRKRKGKSRSQRRKKKTRPSGDEPSLSPPSDDMLDTAEDLQVCSTDPCTEQELTEERPMSNSGEYSPTALILGFTKSDAVPSEADLIDTFSRYGPLEEAETEVLRSTNCAKVVFKNRADAEAAYSSTGESSIFGPALVSYRLGYMPSTPKASLDTKKQEKTVEGTGAVSDDMQIEDAGK